jgi:hypothetical protein
MRQIIVAAALNNQGTDAQYFEPMLRRVVANCDAVPALTTGDAGYFSADNVLATEHMGTEPPLAGGHEEPAAHRSDAELAGAPTWAPSRQAIS